MKTILFSGGFDSTCILNRLTKENDEVHVVMIEPDFIRGKLNRERVSRREIINKIKEKYNCRIITSTVSLGTDDCDHIDCTGLTQPLFWLPVAFMTSANNEDTEIYFGYNLGDQCTCHIKDIENMCKALSNFREGKNIIPYFPLKYKSKAEIIEELFLDDKSLLNLCTTCEHRSLNDWCGECECCKEFKLALLKIIMDKNHCSELHEWCREVLLTKFAMNIEVSYIKED